MLWLAFKLVRAGELSQVDAERLNVTFWQGVGLQFLNIKAWMLALTLTAGWVVNAAGQPSTNPGERLAIICVVMVPTLACCTTTISAGPSRSMKVSAWFTTSTLCDVGVDNSAGRMIGV